MKKKKVIDLEILEDFLDSGVSKISLVSDPAIEVDWFAFKEEEFVYPNTGETEDEFLGRCVAVNIDEGRPRDQAVAICYRVWKEHSMNAGFSYDPALPPYTDQITEDKKKKEKMEGTELDIFGYQTEYFYICPGAVATFEGWMSTAAEDDTIGMIRSAAQIADNVFKIEKDVIEAESTTEAQMKQALVLIDDYKDLAHEIDEELGTISDVAYMDGHAEVIAKYFTEEFDLDEACWPGYEAIGTKIKDGKRVPNCVPVENSKMSKLMFADEDEQIIVGPAMIPDMEIIRKDENGDPYYVKFTKEVVAKIAEKFMRELRNADTNIEHEEIEAGSYVMETWLVEDPEHDKINTKYGFNLPEGTWAVKMRVQDPETWKLIKAGELNGFSIEGNFMSKEDYEDYMKDRKTYERISKILKSL